MSEEKRVAKHAGLVGAATMLSRVLGLVREQVMATFFGAGLFTDAFNVAFRIPNLLRDLFAEGAMSSAFIPTFTEYRQKKGDAEAWALGHQLMVSLFLVLAAVCLVGFLVAPWLVKAFAPGFSAIEGKQGLTVLLTRVMLPFLPAVAMAAAAMGMLNAHGRFGVPALAPAMLNLGMIVVGVGLIPVCEQFGQPAILAMALGALVGAIAQFAFQLPALHKLGFKLRFERPKGHPGVIRIAKMMLPASFGLAATQLNLFVSTLIASLLIQGSVSWLWYAYRLMQLPIGVFGVALATVSLPALSRAVVANDMPAMKSTLSATLRLVFLLTVPAAVWLAVMARPLVAFLYEHGQFTTLDTEMTGGALMMYCVGLPAFAAVGVLTRTFYALGDTKTPVRASFVAVGLNIALNLLLMGPMGHLGLALATSATAVANLVQLVFFLRRRIGSLGGRRIASTIGRVLIASAIGAAVCAIGLSILDDRWYGLLVLEAYTVIGGLVVGAGAMYLAMKLMRVEELDALDDLMRAMIRKFGGK